MLLPRVRLPLACRRVALLRDGDGGATAAAHLAALDREEQLLRADFALLEEFAREDAVTVNGVRIEAKCASSLWLSFLGR